MKKVYANPKKSSSRNNEGPDIIPKVVSKNNGRKESECFQVDYAAGILNVTGDGELGAAYGESLMTSLASSGQWVEFLGASNPRFFLRPLWIGKPLQAFLLSSLKNHEASFIEIFCQRVIELGYNAAIFTSDANQSKMKHIAQALKNKGLKFILKLAQANAAVEQIKEGSAASICPLNASQKELASAMIEDAIKAPFYADYLMWESYCCHPDYINDPLSEASTRSEILQEELKWLENAPMEPSH